MGRHKQVECRICLKTMRSDHLERHKEQHMKKMKAIDESECSRSVLCDKGGKHKYVEYKICLKTMRSDNLVRHMKTHEKKTNGIKAVTEKIEYNSDMNVTALKNSIMKDAIEYLRKLELGGEI